MNRRAFGTWGLELSDDDFVRALAARGVAGSHAARPAVTVSALVESDVTDLRVSWNLGENPASILAAEFQPEAASWASAWPGFLQTLKNPDASPSKLVGPRLELTGLRREYWIDIIEFLSRPAVGARSVYVCQNDPAGDVGWNWPIQVGFLNDKASRNLREQIQREVDERPWRGEYLRLLSPRKTLDRGCHLLLLPFELQEAVSKVTSLQQAIRATSGIVLGGSSQSPRRTAPLLDALRSQLRCEGIALVTVQPEQRPEWLVEYARGLSHNLAFDGALFDVWRTLSPSRTPGVPIIVCSQWLARESQIIRRLVRLAKQLRELKLDKPITSLKPSTRRSLKLASPQMSNEELANEIDARLVTYRFEHESDEGMGMLDILERSRAARQKLERRPRWLQARVETASPSPAARHAVTSFLPDVHHIVSVFVGEREANAIQPPPDAPSFPEERLSPGSGNVMTVVFSEPVLSPTPQVGTLFLPREGRSSECHFFLHVPMATRHVDARIILLFRNRVLQTARLRWSAAEVPTAGASALIALNIEEVARAKLEGLESCSDFDAAVLLNHSSDGNSGATVIRAGQARRFRLPKKMADAVTWFDQRLEEVVDSPEDFAGGLWSPASEKLLNDMANRGYLLWSAFDDLLPEGVNLADLHRVQVVTADPDTRLPVEFFYEYAAPLPGARLCENAVAALDRGRCLSTCPQGSERSSVVCPLGFWCMSKVVERHLHRQGEHESDDGLTMPEPLEGRRRLPVLTKALLAASDRVDKVKSDGIKSVCTALAGACGVESLDAIRDWETWKTSVANGASLLMIMPHVVSNEDTANLPAMEIGADSRLRVSNVEFPYVNSPSGREPPPIVFLLGCETGKADFPFDSLIARIRKSGAAIVVCTGSAVLGSHAAPVAVEFLNALKESRNGATSLAEVMLKVRRKMLLRGLPIVFTLMAFGDADWQV